MNAARWHLTYPEDVISEPLLWQLAHEHGLRTNIRRANVEEHVAWVIVEVHGDDETLRSAREWLESRGVAVRDLPD